MSANATTSFPPVITEEDLASGFPIDRDWFPMGLLWIPFVILGLPANILVIFLGRHAQSMGNFCFAMSAVSLINSLHLLARTIILIDYFSHFWLPIKATVIECSIMGNILDQYVGYYIVFYIPILALYRYLFLSTKNGSNFLSKKRNIWLMIIIAAIIPTIFVAGKLYGMIVERKIEIDEMCPFKYDDNLRSGWCDHIYDSGVIASYCLSLILSILLCIHLYRLFLKSRESGQVQRRKLRDEIRILAGIILHMIIPLLLTILAKGEALWIAIGIPLNDDIAEAVYNYNPLCDAILITLSVKPYRQAFIRLAHLIGLVSSNNHRAENEANAVRIAAIQTINAMRL